MFLPVTLQLLAGFGKSLEIFCLTLLFSIPLGLVVCFGSMSKFSPLRRLVRCFVWIIRGTPLMLQLIIIFYTPGKVLPQNPWNSFSDGRMFACIVAFVINYACYFSVIYRGGIEGVPAGQREAGEVLGMTRTQIFFKVTLLQMVKRVVPPMSNEIITLFGPDHCHHRDHQGRRVFQQVRRHRLAPVLHRGVLSGVRGGADHSIQLYRAQAQLFQVRRGAAWPFWKSATSKRTLPRLRC